MTNMQTKPYLKLRLPAKPLVPVLFVHLCRVPRTDPINVFHARTIILNIRTFSFFFFFFFSFSFFFLPEDMLPIVSYHQTSSVRHDDLHRCKAHCIPLISKGQHHYWYHEERADADIFGWDIRTYFFCYCSIMSSISQRKISSLVRYPDSLCALLSGLLLGLICVDAL